MNNAEWRLIDTDFVTVKAILPAESSNLFIQISDVGSGSLRIPLDSEAAALISEGMFIQCWYRNALRGGFFVENLSEEIASQNEGSGRWLSVSGSGALAIFDDAMVWDDGTGASSREYTGTKAGILIDMIDEAQLNGFIPNVAYDFTSTLDTDSASWDDDEKLTFPVGTSLLAVIRQFTGNNIEFDVSIETNGDFTLHAYKTPIGSDISSTIYFRVGTNAIEVKKDKIGTQIKNWLKLKFRDGFVDISDSTSVTSYRQRADFVNIDAAQSASSARTFGSAQLEITKDPKKSYSVTVYDGVEPYVFTSYNLGDTVSLDSFGTVVAERIVGLQFDFKSEYAVITVSLNSILENASLRMRRDLDRLMNQWNTARDSDLLETSYWAAIGDPNTTYNINEMKQIGTKLYVLSGTYLLIYDIINGGWQRVDLGYTGMSLAHIGGVVYIGCFYKVLKYTIATGITASVADVSLSGGDGVVNSMAVIGTKVYFTGSYDHIGTLTTANIVQYDTVGLTWSDMSDSTGAYTVLMSDGSNLYSGRTELVKKWDTSSWSTLGTYPTGTLSILALAMYDTNVLAAGGSGDIYEWDGATWTLFADANGSIRDIAVYLTDVYATGYFTDAGSYIAKYSGGMWWELETGLDANGANLVLYEGSGGVTVYVSGAFTTAGDKDAQGIAAYFTAFSALADYLESAGKDSFDMAAAIHNAIAKTALVANDEIGFWDSVSQRLRKITWSNVLLTIKAYTDGLYVALTGAQTIAGVKTFSSDPIVPDEAYDATAWNGSLEPPTKNAVRDKIESMSSGGTPAGSDTQIQYNNAGAFGANSKFLRDSTNSLIVGETPSVTTTTNGIFQSGDLSIAHFMESFGSGVASFITFVRGQGTKASPTAVLLDDVLGRIRGRGFDGAGNLGATSAEIRMIATENHSTSAHGTSIEFHGTPNTSTTLTKRLSILQTGELLLSAYGAGTFTGTIAKMLGVTSTGDVIEKTNDGWTAYSAVVPTRIASTLDGTFTVTIASPAVVTKNSHGLVTGQKLRLTTTGALPTGLATATDYYVIVINTNTFNLATSFTNAIAGTKINTSGSQSGTHSIVVQVDPVYTMQFAGVDLTGVLQEGTPIKWTQNSIVRYGWICATPTYASSNTSISVLTRLDDTSTNYDVLDTATFTISAFAYGFPKQTGFGFPLTENYWTATTSDTTNTAQASPTAGTVYNIASLAVLIPIGTWRANFNVDVWCDVTNLQASVQAALSTSASSISDNTFRNSFVGYGTSVVSNNLFREKIPNLQITTPTLYYLVETTGATGVTNIRIRGDIVTTEIKLICAYV